MICTPFTFLGWSNPGILLELWPVNSECSGREYVSPCCPPTEVSQNCEGRTASMLFVLKYYSAPGQDVMSKPKQFELYNVKFSYLLGIIWGIVECNNNTRFRPYLFDSQWWRMCKWNFGGKYIWQKKLGVCFSLFFFKDLVLIAIKYKICADKLARTEINIYCLCMFCKVGI